MTGNPGVVRQTGAAALVLAWIAGCASHGVRPNEAAERSEIEAGTCPDIDGTYLAVAGNGNLVDVLNGDHGIFWKSAKRLGRRHERELDPYTTIQLRREGKRLYVTGARASGVTRSFDLRVRRTCRHSLLLVDSTMVFDPTLAAYFRTTHSLGRTGDGSLRVLKKESGGALVVLFKSESHWMVFPRVASVPAQKP